MVALIFLAADELHRDFIGALHHVVVGNDITGGVNDKAGAQAAGLEALGHLPEKLVKKFPEGVFLPEGGRPARSARAHPVRPDHAASG